MRETVSVYLAARSEDQAFARALAASWAAVGIGCTARWLESNLQNESHDEAQGDVDDIRRADVFVLYKPALAHRVTTGGHHVETGMALEMGKPVILLGAPENVFHQHRRVVLVAPPVAPAAFAAIVRAAAVHGTPLPAGFPMPRQRAGGDA